MDFKVVILGKYPCSKQFLLQRLHKVQEVLKLAATDVIDIIRRYRQTVLASLLLLCFLHHTANTFHNVIHAGEVPAAAAIVVLSQLYSLGTFYQCVIRRPEMYFVTLHNLFCCKLQHIACFLIHVFQWNIPTIKRL